MIRRMWRGYCGIEPHLTPLSPEMSNKHPHPYQLQLCSCQEIHSLSMSPLVINKRYDVIGYVCVCERERDGREGESARAFTHARVHTHTHLNRERERERERERREEDVFWHFAS